jgi:hypothetical protein
MLRARKELREMEWLLMAATLAAFGFGYWLLEGLGQLLDGGERTQMVWKNRRGSMLGRMLASVRLAVKN